MMLKKIGLVAAVAAAGMVLFGGMASATSYPSSGHNHTGIGNSGVRDQVGLVNLNNLDALHNVNVPIGVCRNAVNVLGIQANVDHVLGGLNVPVLSPGANGADGGAESCATGAIDDGGTHQAN